MTEEFLVLIVDDNVNNIFALKLLLTKLPGIKILEASSGEDALLLCIQHQVHLILLDIQMPKMDGYETARHLQMMDRTRTIPIVFLTAHLRSEAFIQQGYALGAVDYLTKPIDDNLLLNRVRHYQHLYDRETNLREKTNELQNTTHQLQNTLNRLQQTQAQLIQSEKLAALGRIVAVVAHELNTPIGNCLTVATTLDEKNQAFETIIKSGEPLKRGQMLDYLAQTHEAMNMIARGLGRAGELVENFKKISVDQESDEKKKFDLKTVIETTITLLSLNDKESRWAIKIDVAPTIILHSYPETIEQIIAILFDNALTHGFEGKHQGMIHITAQSNHHKLWLSFSDDGCGMSEETLQRIFDPFFTTRLGKGNNGLGMSICYNLIEGILGGHVNVQSQLGAGTTVHIEIPLVAPELALS